MKLPKYLELLHVNILIYFDKILMSYKLLILLSLLYAIYAHFLLSSKGLNILLNFAGHKVMGSIFCQRGLLIL